jgi:hypothetical protein
MVMNPPRQAHTMLKLSTARVGIANPTCQGNQEISVADRKRSSQLSVAGKQAPRHELMLGGACLLRLCGLQIRLLAKGKR